MKTHLKSILFILLLSIVPFPLMAAELQCTTGEACYAKARELGAPYGNHKEIKSYLQKGCDLKNGEACRSLLYIVGSASSSVHVKGSDSEAIQCDALCEFNKKLVYQQLERHVPLVACGALTPPEWVQPLSDPATGKLYYVALWGGDKECMGGTATGSYFLTVFKYAEMLSSAWEEYPFKLDVDIDGQTSYKDLYVRQIDAFKVVSPWTVEIEYSVHNYLSGSYEEGDPMDANCCPSVQEKTRMTYNPDKHKWE